MGAWLLGWVVATATACASTREIYVWQRAASPELTAALHEFADKADGFCALAAEVTWQKNQPQVVRVPLDYVTLKTLGRPVSLALRVGPFSGDAATAAPALANLAHSVLAAARAGGFEPAELQIDFDCAESKLAGYRAWLEALRPAVGNTKLVFTALPVWLKHAEFAALAHAADGYVLQVHSLERPSGPDVAFSLCDPVRALAWARQAELVGVPFRVALPTYGYVLGFDPAGKFLGLSADGPRRDWPHDTQLRAVRAEAPAMARLAAELTRAALPHCAGVIWFRLPLATDRLNWNATTLAAILRGEIPTANLAVEVEWSSAGLAEVVIVNRGTTTEPLPRAVTVAWPAAERILLGDGLGGFHLENATASSQAILRAADVPADASIAPGRKMKIAWLRFAHELSLTVSSSAPP